MVSRSLRSGVCNWVPIIPREASIISQATCIKPYCILSKKKITSSKLSVIRQGKRRHFQLTDLPAHSYLHFLPAFPICIFYLYFLFCIFGCFPTTDLQTPSLRSGHLDIKDTQYVEINDGRKISYHIINAPTWHPKNSNFFKIGQICRVYWNWSGAHFLHTWRLFVWVS